jgi:hypothetical protein
VVDVISHESFHVPFCIELFFSQSEEHDTQTIWHSEVFFSLRHLFPLYASSGDIKQ